MLLRILPRLLSQRTFSCAESVVLPPTAGCRLGTVALPIRHTSPRHTVSTLHSPSRRALSTPATHVTDSDMPMNRYHALADATMVSLLEGLEDILDEVANERFEVDYHSGVLTLNLGSNGTYVINKQPPNKQIWLSSPVSGPKRYDYVASTDDWRYSRDGEEMGSLLEQELSCAFGREVKLGLRRASEVVE